MAQTSNKAKPCNLCLWSVTSHQAKENVETGKVERGLPCECTFREGVRFLHN